MRPREGFNPRTRVGCDRQAAHRSSLSYLFQSTHPRGVRLETSHGRGRRVQEFQSTHPRGVRRIHFHAHVAYSQFQSTHPRGVRHPDQQAQRCAHGVSIHAPAWGATHGQACWRTRIPCFNPRTRVGCDQTQTQTSAVPTAFQSTHPRGVRHVREDGQTQSARVSIHAPAWGATFYTRESFALAKDVSIHAPAWGATHGQACGGARIPGFNPRTRVGCDRAYCAVAVGASKFQSTHPRGVRLFPCFIQ